MSTPELTNQEKLDEMYHLTQENHEILRSMRRRENIAAVLRTFYWLVILASLGGVYFFVNPLIQAFKSNAQSANSPSTMEALQKYLPSDQRFLNLFQRGSSSETQPSTDPETVEPVQ